MVANHTNNPNFAIILPELDAFVRQLGEVYQSLASLTWAEARHRVRGFYSDEQMARVESVLKGWTQMATYYDQITLVHVNLVMMTMMCLPEYQGATPERQNEFIWMALCHDIAKIVPDEGYKRDFTHAFRGAGMTARILAQAGFPTCEGFAQHIEAWCDLLNNAYLPADHSLPERADHRQLPAILTGLDALFYSDSAPHRIVRGVLFHMGLDTLKAWPPPVAFTREEIQAYVTPTLYPTLKAMYLADSWAWALLYPEQVKPQLKEIRSAFAGFAHIIGVLQ
ncbi:MAG: hypothetical protein ACFE0Q_11025 [Anaerolineae bacterium]